MLAHNTRTLLTLVTCTIAATSSAAAAEQIGKFTVDIHIEGTQEWKGVQDHGSLKINESYHIVTHVQSNGEPDNINTKDPGYADMMMAKAAAVQRQVQKAQGKSAVAAPKSQQEYMAQQQALGLQMQKGQAACHGDVNCLTKLAQQYAQQSAAITYPTNTPASNDAELLREPTAADYRFLSYFGYDGCPTEIQIKINNSGSGAFADVNGMVPFTDVEQADTRGTDNDRKMQCLHQTTVYDTKERKIYTDGFGPPAVRGLYLHHEGGRPEVRNNNEEVSGASEALDWVSKQLRIAPASGTLTTTLPAPARPLVGVATSGAKFSGQLKVALSWKFEPGALSK